MTEKIPTPYFLLDEPVLQRYFDMLTKALKENWPNYQIGYSFKTNSLPWLVNFYKAGSLCGGGFQGRIWPCKVPWI